MNRSRADALLLAGFCAFLFFFGLSFFGLVGADEPRYAQVAREMLARHDWVTPLLGGKPWLEKPILYYWQALLAYRIFGVSDWAARLPSAFDATLMVVGIYMFLRRFRPEASLDGALMTASAAGVIGFARAASMDMPLAAMLTGGLLAWFAWRESDRNIFLAGFYVFIALGMLAKGPVAPLLASIVIVVFAAVTRNGRLIWRTLWLPGILMFCAVTLPWYVAVQLRNPEFLRVFILEHNLARFGTNLYHHTEPFWFYVPVILLGLLPWTVFVIAALGEAARNWSGWTKTPLERDDELQIFLLIWLVVPVVFFSLAVEVAWLHRSGHSRSNSPVVGILTAARGRGRAALRFSKCCAFSGGGGASVPRSHDSLHPFAAPFRLEPCGWVFVGHCGPACYCDFDDTAQFPGTSCPPLCDPGPGRPLRGGDLAHRRAGIGCLAFGSSHCAGNQPHGNQSAPVGGVPGFARDRVRSIVLSKSGDRPL